MRSSPALFRRLSSQTFCCGKRKNPLSRARRKRAIAELSPIPPAQDISGDPPCLDILASVSTYSPRLPGANAPVALRGFRPRLQMRGSVGITPTSHKHGWLTVTFLYETSLRLLEKSCQVLFCGNLDRSRRLTCTVCSQQVCAIKRSRIFVVLCGESFRVTSAKCACS
jgi:hypothetical protein